VKVNYSISVEFQSTTGAFQGDALSGNLFIVVEAAFMPFETVYFDDVDFNNNELDPLREMLPIDEISYSSGTFI
jgi:hypothetical protein